MYWKDCFDLLPGNTAGGWRSTCSAIPTSVCVHWRERLSTILRMPETKGSGELCDGNDTHCLEEAQEDV
jgi:hypothetical protein